MRRTSLLLAGILAAVTLVCGCAKTRSDDQIATDIKARFFSDPQLKDSTLHVKVDHGNVALTGNVTSDGARLEAYKVAVGTPGVSKVDDQMTVQVAQAQPPTSAQGPAPAVTQPIPAPAPPKPRKVRQKPAVKQEEKPEPAAPPGEQAPEAPPPTTPASEAVPAAPTPPRPTPPPAPPPPPPQPRAVQVQPGTMISVLMIDGVDSKVNRPGDVLRASLDSPVVVGNDVIVPRGADVNVKLVNATSAGHYKGKSELELQLINMSYQGTSYSLTSSSYTVSGSSRGKNTAAKVGGGAALGALLGAVIGGGRGAAIGAGAGAAGGGVWNGVTHGQQVKIPSETRLDFRLDQPVTISY